MYVGIGKPSDLRGYIEEYDESDNFVKSFYGGLNPFTPAAMNIGPNGHLYVASFGLNEFDLNGNLIKTVSVPGCLRGVDFGQDGLIYGGRDCINDIGVLNPDTFQAVRTITGVTYPYGVTFDPENHHLFVANFGANNILEYLYTGEFIGVFASGLSHPNHIAFKSSGTNTSTTTTTTIGPSSKPFEATFNWNDNFWIYGQEPDPLIYGFDYFISPEKINTSFAGKTINIESVEFQGYGNNLGAIINWDFELHLSNQPIGLPSGQYIASHVWPTEGYSRNAPVIVWGVIGAQHDTNSYNFYGGNDFINNNFYAYPYLASINVRRNQQLNISNGLYSQFFFWTGDNRNCHLQFNSGVKIIVRGKILEPTTLISLSSFTATPKAGRVVLESSTASEIDNAGFNLYRSEVEDSQYVKINTSMISAEGASSQGASSEFIDNAVQNRKTYYYKLEDIDLNGTSTMHGPLSAMPIWIYGMGKK